MTRARFFFPDVRLKRLLAERGGIRVKDALSRANEAIEGVRADCLHALDGKIAEIATYEPGNAEMSRRCYTLSNEIYAEAGLFGLAELSGVAHNLCEIFSVGPEGCASQRVVRVYVDAMQSLRSPVMSENRRFREAVIEELHLLTSRLTHHSKEVSG